MFRRAGLVLLVVGVCLLPACQRVQQYRIAAVKEGAKEEDPIEQVPLRFSMMEQKASERLWDVSIVFVPSTRAEEWKSLPVYWNEVAAPLNLRLAPFGLPPLQAAAALVLADAHDVIKIKVPLGLPDPTKHIPRTNPLMYRQLKLGKDLFAERLLPGDYACATCHIPQQGFTEEIAAPPGEFTNTLSLLNVVYNRRQFWDGRVRTLEETVVRSLDDERLVHVSDKRRALKQHIWGGFVPMLIELGRYDKRFKEAFGVEQPTQDTIARALATYMRTLLAGDSLFDRANQLRGDSEKLSAEHFNKVLDDKLALTLQEESEKKYPRADMPAMLAKGYELFQGKARCGQCHQGALFTDHDYHNVGYPDVLNNAFPLDKETGRSLFVPIGQKERRFIGAFRTPSLRNLLKTKPYYHDGRLWSLRSVVDFYDDGIISTPYLAKQLQDGERGIVRLKLAEGEKDALVMFLRSLDSIVMAPAP